jgi:hypothetical protein
MLQDRYGNPLSTSSQVARDAYVDAVDRTLAATEGAAEQFEAAIVADANFALAHIALARHHQVWGNRDAIAPAVIAAQSATGLTTQEQAHVNAFSLLLTGKVAAGYAAIRAHVLDYPRDALIAQTCTGVFSLIGFSGQPGREAELLAFTSQLAPAYGDDWWFTGQHAFSQMEAGQVGPAAAMIETSLNGNPRNANAAHIKSHLFYENGETAAGRDYLSDWMHNYDRAGLLHCHLSWHSALWALEQGDTDQMWAVIDADLQPAKTQSPSLNVMTDMASILYRAERRGVQIAPERWHAVSDYAAQCFPKPGLAFADVHAALAHAMAGNSDALSRIIDGAKGPASDVVKVLAQAFGAIAAQNWAEAQAHLTIALQDHARIGGSRAQRDLVEFAMSSVLLRQGQTATARQLLAIRRPNCTHEGSVLQ